MAKASKRTGRKSPHKKSLFASHFQRALKNKELNKERDNKLKVKAELKKTNFVSGQSKRHRHIWKLEGYSDSSRSQICNSCEHKRIKRYVVNLKNLQSRRAYAST